MTQQLRQAQNGDMDAFAALFEPLRTRIHAVACRLVGPDDAEDVVMDTFLKAWQALPKFAGRSTLSTWLCGIARHQALDLLRRRSRRERDRQVGRDDNDPLTHAQDITQSSPSELARQHDDQSTVSRAMQALPELHSQILLLRYVDELSYNEISAALGISIGTTMSRLFNAKRKLRDAVRELTAHSAKRIKEAS